MNATNHYARPPRTVTLTSTLTLVTSSSSRRWYLGGVRGSGRQMPGHVPAHRAMQLPAKLSRNSIGGARSPTGQTAPGDRRRAPPPPPPPFFRFVLSVRRALSFFVVASAVNWLAVRTQLYDCSYSPVGCSTLARAVTSWNHRKHTETVITSCTNYFLSFLTPRTDLSLKCAHQYYQIVF